MAKNEKPEVFENRISKAKFISIKDAMTLTGLSRSTLFRLRQNNLIKFIEIDTTNTDDGRKTVRILKTSLLEYLKNKEV